MADDLTMRGPADRSRVNVHETHEVSYWCKTWSVTPEQLRAAVAKVGVMSDDVKRYLDA